MNAPPRRVRGPTDPDRAARIADAALTVAVRDGLGAVTHRAVAREAGVPLGSTTYHYAGLDALLIAALDRGTATYAAELEPLIAAVGSGGDPVALLVASMRAYLADPGRVAVEYELYVAASRRPPLRETARAWLAVLPDALTQLVGREAADEIATFVDGACLRAACTGRAPTAAELERPLRLLLGDRAASTRPSGNSRVPEGR